MDQFFTGIPNEIFAKLRAVPKFEMDPFYAEILRPDGSIIQMKSKHSLISFLYLHSVPSVSKDFFVEWKVSYRKFYSLLLFWKKLNTLTV